MTPAPTPPVPNPVETRIVTVCAARQPLSDEQRGRIKAWMAANGVDPKNVSASHPVTVEYKTTADRNEQSHGHIHFTQYYADEEGHRWSTCSWERAEAVAFPRCVPQKVELPPEPIGGRDA